MAALPADDQGAPIDLRPHGAWHYVLRGPDGAEHGFRGEYREVVPPERLVYTEAYDVEGLRDHPSLVTVTFAERDGRTTMTSVSLYESPEYRDGHIAGGMEVGTVQTLDRLAELLATLRRWAPPTGGRRRCPLLRPGAVPSVAFRRRGKLVRSTSARAYVTASTITDCTEETRHVETDVRQTARRRRGSVAAPASAFAQATPGPETASPEGTPGGTPVAGPTPRTGYAPVNGLDLYDEIHGTGQPLVLLHGGLATADLQFGHLLPALARTRQVVVVDLQGHGHTADVDRPLGYEAMADDTAALIGHLGLERADVFGFSLGGGVAPQTAVRHPERVRKLVVASTPYRRDGWYPEVLAATSALDADAAAAMVGTPLDDAYVRAAPKPDDWPTLVAKVGRLLGQDDDWPTAVAAIEAPALVVVGDADRVRPEHAVELFRLLGGGVPGDVGPLPDSRFAVLPGTAHSAATFRADPLLPIVGAFLDAPPPEGRRAAATGTAACWPRSRPASSSTTRSSRT